MCRQPERPEAIQELRTGTVNVKTTIQSKYRTRTHDRKNRHSRGPTASSRRANQQTPPRTHGSTNRTLHHRLRQPPAPKEMVQIQTRHQMGEAVHRRRKAKIEQERSGACGLWMGRDSRPIRQPQPPPNQRRRRYMHRVRGGGTWVRGTTPTTPRRASASRQDSKHVYGGACTTWTT